MANPSAVRDFAKPTTPANNRFSGYSVVGGDEPYAVFTLTKPESKSFPTVNVDGVGEHDEGHVTRTDQLTSVTLNISDVKKIISHSTNQAGHTHADLLLMNSAYAGLQALSNQPAPTV